MSIVATGWSLLNIIAKVRNITGTPSDDQLSKQAVVDYINHYYAFDMPHELKVQIENKFLDFKTTPGINVYSFPGAYLTDSPGAYADGFPLVFYEDPDIFYQDWPQQYSVNIIGAGNGVNQVFNGTAQGFPIIVGSFFITDGVQVLQDNGLGVLVDAAPGGTGTGTINYFTGAFTSTFQFAPAANLTVYVKYIAYQGNRPQGVMFFENQFTLMPVPDQVYQIRMQGFVFPAQLINDADTPYQAEWGPLIAYGAALEIFSDRGDIENHDRYFPMLKRQENVALGRSIQELTNVQGVARF